MEPQPTTSVAFSDSLLVSVSVAGFCVLAVTIYKIVLSRVRSADEVEKEDLSPDELLARADVATLNRAQRRARAKVIMKEQRRAAVLAAAAVEGEGEEQPAAPAEEEHEEAHHAQLSRKERQAAAKAAEKEERRLYQGERQKQQEEAVHAAQLQKKERLAAEAARQEQERRQAARLEQERRAAWSTFLATETKSQSVEEFRRETKENRIVRLDRVAESFGGVDVSVVEDRIQQLMAEGRIAGFFDRTTSSEEKRFVVVSSDELKAIAASILDQGTVTLTEIATLCERVMNGGDGNTKH